MYAVLNFAKRFAKSSILAIALFAGGWNGQAAQADDLPAWGEGIVIVPASAQPEAQAVQVRVPAFKRGKLVEYRGNESSGTIIVSTKRKLLTYVLGNGTAVQYRVATAKPGFEWSGTHNVSAKAKWPSWNPPADMRKRRPELPEFMAGGPENPLGARAIYLGSSIYRIHGTNEPKSIGKSASSGCIRMLNADVEELYQLVKIGAKVIVI